AEMCGKHVAERDRVVQEEGPVEGVLRGDGSHRGGIVLLARQSQGRIAGEELLEEKDQHGNEEQRWQQREETARDVEPERHDPPLSALRELEALEADDPLGGRRDAL